MPDRLPPLTALRAFDAAARHMSFAKAAEELHVTPAALSFQIKSLEQHLGQPLFRRLNRAVELTEAGRALAPGAAEGFRALSAAWQQARRLTNDTNLTVTAGPGFTAKWLAPRLYDFARAHPEIELKFSASLRMMDFDRDGIDVAIRFGQGDDDGLCSLPLSREWVTPVMTPELAQRYPTPESLREAPFIFDDSISFLTPPCDWPAWFRAVGIDFAPAQGAHFSQADHAVDAALSGMGVVLGRRSMVVTDLHEGRLVAPYGIAVESRAGFRFLCPLGTEDRPQVRAFREWILAEIEKTSYVSDALTIIPVEDVPPA
ncbi:transcriptional regulator GcvA [Jhaorihella thermophila]|uniref:LysR family transcriptional regulator, glycine cleavage system transcriptional activator n=1 Tax=Jhaorihella thermophila TaxID=488547 RepID=A0A1H5YAB8_9RHOB|nr:transcriptional regulator GcvA [Jhaorihella thermophila]SEG21039.1 LysR family transcriptional regulator, glycine cleavage system transcriptional activator [Jhaorihella thermophila]